MTFSHSNQTQPTEEQLRASYEERKRFDWPQTYEQAMNNPLLARLVDMHARAKILSAGLPSMNPKQHLALPQKPLQPRPHQFSGKDAASGEKQDETN